MPVLSKISRRRSTPLSGAALPTAPILMPSKSSVVFEPSARSLGLDADAAREIGAKGRSAISAAIAEESRLAMAGLAHDARNMFAALKLYCDLLAEPGVLTPQHLHYADELKLVAQTGGRLVECLSTATVRSQIMPEIFATPIRNLGLEVEGNRSILAALAGTAVSLEVECLPCPGRVRLSAEDLTRVLVNLVGNAREAMPQGGRIRVTAQMGEGASFLTGRAATSGSRPTVVVCVQDNGPGMPAAALDRIFQPGFTTKAGDDRGWTVPQHRGFGLSIVRSLAENAGGVVRVVSRLGRGTRFEIELPLMRPERKRYDSREGSRVQF